ncbi:patatin-like phospholipase family protein [Gimesia benthica]|uniref:Patatin-like phospholipase family protein n=1 Tax=Gimesia benthica TaxID=2608982 RepID=A0A6I6A776_9PLAN|nr:patatin-like phospholipase family protein [Gimesia benthica]QGQ22207.1 patatin-like phospholipase family protein [Gimesia benthica]
MPKYGLALSGGGFRATLYHLGVVRFLRDIGALKEVTDIASVSGGSILAAHLALNWDRYTGDEDSFNAAAQEVIELIQFDVRNHIVRRMPLQALLSLLSRLHLWNSRNITPNAILERYYRDRLYGDRCIYELPEQPMLHILTTNVSSGGMSVFNRNGLYIQTRSDDGNTSFRHIPGEMAGIPKVVGASSAFPGFFPPAEINAEDLGVQEGEFPTEYFTDGGVYDNLGLRTFFWLKDHGASFDQVFVSDAGKPFQILTEGALGFVGQMVRASEISMDRVWQLEQERFHSTPGFVFFPMTNMVELEDDPTAMHPVIQAEVQGIRTDLDHFSNLEVTALAMHGYEVSRNVCRQEKVFGDQELPACPPWGPKLKLAESPLAAETREPGSHEPAHATRISRELRKSSRRRIWGTLLDWLDWPSYIYVAIAFVILILAPYKFYQFYQISQTQKMIITAIKLGDNDIHQILDLVTIDPTQNWVSAAVQEKPDPSQVSYAGFEVLEHNRIIDLRHWNPDAETEEQRGLIYLRDRITFKKLPTYKGDGHLVFQVPVRDQKMQFRQPHNRLQCSITRITNPVDLHGQKRRIYEFDYDVSELPPDESTTIEMEVLLDYPNSARAPFRLHTKTDLIAVWLLFPTDRPYHTYSLLSYPIDGSEAPRLMNPRYNINHPYGSLIGWSVVNPDENRIYECRWTFE